MPDWYYQYWDEERQQTVKGAVRTPGIPGLVFSQVRDQLIRPFLSGLGVRHAVGLKYESAENAPEITPVEASDIASHIMIGKTMYSTHTGNPAESTLVLRGIKKEDLAQATAIWNAVVAAGDSFPGDAELSEDEAWEMFMAQTQTVCALVNGKVAGLYILHPNNIGRCGHIANASYAVCAMMRGQGIGRALVCDCIERARQHGFRGLQFNAVVASNTTAIALYLQLGFKIIGTISGGYRYKDEGYRDTLIFLKTLED